jgi:hypothetical protein
MNDTFNISNDRVRLATMPTMKGKKYVLEDTDSVYIEPMHVIELDNPGDDLMEMQFSDDIGGAMNQLAVLRDMQQTVHSIFPGTMGNLPVRASTTATAVAGADSRANQRGNYKMMTFDNTAMADLYWMIQQMTYQHAKPETGQKLMGEKIFAFNPALDYFYKPLSQSVESEQGKRMKIQQLDSILQKVIAVQHPKAVIMFNMLMGKILDLMGDEYSYYAQFLLDEQMPLQAENQGSQPATGPGGPVSNEYMIPQTTDEMGARQTASAGQMGY